MSNPQGKSRRPSLAGRVRSFLCGPPKKAHSPPRPIPRLTSSTIPLRKMYTHENAHLPSVPASTIAANHPNSSRVSGWWNMYDELTGGPLPTTSGFVDVDLEAGPSAVPTTGLSRPGQQQQRHTEPIAGPSRPRQQQQQQRHAEPIAGPSRPRQQQHQQCHAEPVAGPSRPRQQQQQQRHAEPEPEPETASSREGSIHSIDFFNGRVTGRADPKDKGKGKQKVAPKRPERRQGAGVFEA